MAEQRKGRGVIVALLLLILAAFAYSVWQRYELVEKTIDLGWSSKAKRTPFLAIQKYLEQRGSQVKQSYQRQAIDDALTSDAEQTVDTLLITDSALITSQERLDALYQWAQNGGHLIIGASGHNELSDDALLEHFGFFTYKSEAGGACMDTHDCLVVKDPDDKEQNLDEPDNAFPFEWPTAQKQEPEVKTRRDQYEANVDSHDLTTLFFENEQELLSLHFGTDYGLWHHGLNNDDELTDEGHALNRAGTESDTFFVQLELDQGLVTTVASSDIWNNHHAAYFDHALTLEELIGPEAKLLILYGSKSPDIIQRIARFFPETLACLAVLLLLWLWQQGVRAGALVNASAPHRRALSEHVRASAQYLWQSKHSGRLLAAARKNLLQKAAQRWPGIHTLTPEQQIKHLQEACNLPAQQLREALFTRADNPNTDQFLHWIHTLQTVRKSL